MTEAEIMEYGNHILNTFHFTGESSKDPKVLLVEGKTDVAFINHINREKTVCRSISELMAAYLAFRTKPTEPINNKELIRSIILRLSKDPTRFNYPIGSEKWPFYGMVDNDYENPVNLVQVAKLIFTGTHDIETLMLSTDKNLLINFKLCHINPDEIKAAYYLAYQLAYFRQAIYRAYKQANLPKEIPEKDKSIDYSKFTENNHIIIKKLLLLINARLNEKLSSPKIKNIQDTVLSLLKNKLTKEGLWKQSLDTFSIDQKNDFWEITNGHDILSALRYVSEETEKAFQDAGGFSINRRFEMALSDSYDYHCFVSTDLYSKLYDAELITDCT